MGRLVLAGIVCLAPATTLGFTREVWYCAAGNMGQCWLSLSQFYGGGVGEYIHGREEGTPARGPNPLAGVWQGSTDVDEIYDMIADVHEYYDAKFGRDGPNGLGGIGDGVSEPHDHYVAFMHVEGGASGPSACPAGGGAFAPPGVVGFCTDSVSHDAVGHELNHHVSYFLQDNGDGTFTPLTYLNESGALNEGMADCFGEAFERYMTGTNNWLLVANESGSPVFRNMADPPSVDSTLSAGLPVLPPDR